MSKIVEVPVRCCGIGGWLDTWFAEYGEVLNLGVFSRYFGSSGPFRGVEVMVGEELAPTEGGQIVVRAADPNYDVRVASSDLQSHRFDRRNLLLAVLSLFELEVASDINLVIRIASPIPPGASLGTSAAVAVGLVRTLGAPDLTAKEVAKLAWRAETEVMGGQSGVQDQIAAVLTGDAHRISVRRFSGWELDARRLTITEGVRRDLEAGLITVYYGSHNSSFSHQAVIQELEREGSESPRLQRFRNLAERAEHALIIDSSLTAFGRIMDENTEAQIGLCPGIVSLRAISLIAIAKEQGAWGCKVNGAGGEGGTVTCLFSSRRSAQEYRQSLIQKFGAGDLKFFEHRLAGSFLSAKQNA